MSIENTIPSNRNFLSSLKFRFLINKTPMTNYFAQSVKVPGMMIQNIEYPNPFIQIPVSGDHIEFDSQLEVTFIIDEEMLNYLEIYNWMIGLGYPDKLEQYGTLAANSLASGLGIKSDVTVMILDSKENEKFNIVFTDAFPTSLSGLSFDSRQDTVDYFTAVATFRFTRYYLKSIN